MTYWVSICTDTGECVSKESLMSCFKNAEKAALPISSDMIVGLLKKGWDVYLVLPTHQIEGNPKCRIVYPLRYDVRPRWVLLEVT